MLAQPNPVTKLFILVIPLDELTGLVTMAACRTCYWRPTVGAASRST